jgi:hypothetical protein
MEPTLSCHSWIHEWPFTDPNIPRPGNHLYVIQGQGWTPGTMVFITFEWMRASVQVAASQAGPSGMAQPNGTIQCFWMDSGQAVQPGGAEDRRVTAITNDGTGRTVGCSINGPALVTDTEPPVKSSHTR